MEHVRRGATGPSVIKRTNLPIIRTLVGVTLVGVIKSELTQIIFMLEF